MSFYFSIIGSKDNPLFTHTFGTSRQGADGHDRFREEVRRLTPFIVHSSLDILEEVMWASGNMYLKNIDRYGGCYISGFVTGAGVKFLLLSTSEVAQRNLGEGGGGKVRGESAFTGYNATSATTEEAIKNFFLEIYDVWVKNVMNPFYRADMEVTSAVFRAKVAGAAKKFL